MDFEKIARIAYWSVGTIGWVLVGAACLWLMKHP